ncbi:MAG: thiamine pyrophosphate-binding protein [Asticcacaulis sp.]
MTASTTPRTGGQILVDQLRLHGTEDVFCVPGESYLAVLDALYDTDIKLVVARQEGGAAMMAEAAGKLSGRPGICMVTRGPGAANASAGLHIADQDSTPMILFVGQVARDMTDREAFQELDYRAVFGSMAKWVVEIQDAARIPELIRRAFQVATQGRPGPVVVALPEDMLTDVVSVADAAPYSPVLAHPAPEAMQTLKARLEAAKAPVLLLGGSGWSAEAVADMADFADRWDLPAFVTFRRQMLFPADHRCYGGDLGIGPNPKLLARIKAADLILLVGGRLSEMPSQSYSLLDIPGDGARLVHVHPGAEELNKVYHAGLGIQAAPTTFAAALRALSPDTAPCWAGAAEAAHAAYLDWSDPARITIPGDVQMGAVMQTLIATLPADSILCNGAGNYATWVHRFWPFRLFGTQLAPTSGSMGYGVPAAVGGRQVAPSRTVVAFAGDGCFLMHGQEFGTAVQYGLKLLVIVVDNAMYGTIRMHQAREYPGRPSGTMMQSPDFAALARAYGGHGETVETTDAFAPALERALAADGPALIHIRISPEAITPSLTLSQIEGGK